METVKQLVEDKPVVIFSKTGCPVSHSITQLISGYGANPTMYELDQMQNGREIDKGRRPTVLSVFIGGNFVGGPNDMISIQVQGRLPQMLMDAGAIWVWTRNYVPFTSCYGLDVRNLFPWFQLH